MMTTTRKTGFILTALIVALCLTLAACGGNDTPSGGGNGGDTPAETRSLSGAIAEQPVLLTSAGQSADYEMIKVVLDNNDISYSANMLASKDDFGDAKTLVVAIGGSSKGLGAAGIDADAELERVRQLLADAKDAGLTIIACHVGGDGRRGQLGDRYIEPCVVASDYTIVVEGGNDDGLFTTIAANNDIPIDVVPSITEVIPAIGGAFK